VNEAAKVRVKRWLKKMLTRGEKAEQPAPPKEKRA
jgi:hypothetical protein